MSLIHMPAYKIRCTRRGYFQKETMNKVRRETIRYYTTHPDGQSPHCYISDDFIIDMNDVLFDMGSAEGIIPLTHIERISHVVLFEKDTEWIEALEATFAPWTEKVTLSNHYVSDHNGENFISIDYFLKTYPHRPSFVKTCNHPTSEKA